MTLKAVSLGSVIGRGFFRWITFGFDRLERTRQETNILQVTHIVSRGSFSLEVTPKYETQVSQFHADVEEFTIVRENVCNWAESSRSLVANEPGLTASSASIFR